MPSTLRKLQTVGPVVASKTNLRKPQNGYRLRLPAFDADKLAKDLAADQCLASQALLQEKENAERYIREYNEKLKIYKQKVKDIGKKLTEEYDVKKLFEKTSKETQRIFKNLLIIHGEYLPVNGTVFTTDLLKTKNGILGQFRIHIFWGGSNYRNNIKIMNTYHTNGSCDHPCVKDGRICPGNFDSIASTLYRNKDVYGLLEAIMAFLLSDDISAGYIKKWDRWNSGLQVKTSERRPFGWEARNSDSSLVRRHNQLLAELQGNNTEETVATVEDVPF